MLHLLARLADRFENIRKKSEMNVEKIGRRMRASWKVVKCALSLAAYTKAQRRGD